MARKVNQNGDLTISRKRLQTMFAQAARQLRALLGTEADYFLAHDEQGNILHLSPFKRGQLSTEMENELTQTILESSSGKLKVQENFGSHRIISIHNLSAFILGLNLHEIQTTDIPKPMKPIYTAWYVFDHEEAHALINSARSNTPGSRHYKETVADTYAILRHIQRFGKNTGFTVLQAQLAATMLVSNPDYYTSEAIVSAMKLADTVPIDGLSKKMTLDIAQAIATQYQIDENTLLNLASAFSPLKNKQIYTSADFKTLGLSHPDNPDVQKACALASQYIEATARPSSLANGKKISQKSP